MLESIELLPHGRLLGYVNVDHGRERLLELDFVSGSPQIRQLCMPEYHRLWL